MNVLKQIFFSAYSNCTKRCVDDGWCAFSHVYVPKVGESTRKIDSLAEPDAEPFCAAVRLKPAKAIMKIAVRSFSLLRTFPIMVCPCRLDTRSRLKRLLFHSLQIE